MLLKYKCASSQIRYFLRFLSWLGGCLLLQTLGFIFLIMFAPVWTSLQVHELLGTLVCGLVLLHLFINRWFWKELIKPFQNLKTFNSSGELLARLKVLFNCKQDKESYKQHRVSYNQQNTSERTQIGKSVILCGDKRFLYGSCKLWGRALGQVVLWLLTYGIGLFMIADLAIVICSGIFSSQYLFPKARLSAAWFENTNWRQIHTVSAYYLMVGIGVHLGVHLHTLWAFLPKYLKTAVQIMSIVVSWHGIQVWMEGDYWNILMGQLSFGFWDFESNAVWFFTDKLALIAAIAWCFYGVQCAAWKILRL